MADTKMNQTPNQTMKHEQAKSSVSGGSDRQREHGSSDMDRSDKDRSDKSAIGGQQWQQGEKGQSGGGETGQKNDFDQSRDDSASKTGEPGRARNELGSSGSEGGNR